MRSRELYALLWGDSASQPYNHAREASVSARRFAVVGPALDRAARRAKGEGRRLRVLDFGCADGRTAERILAPHTACVDYHGFDVYPLEPTARRLAECGFTCEVSHGDIEAIPPAWRDFDVVLALSCLQYVPSVAAVIDELAARMRPAGLFVGYAYDAGPLRRVTDEYLREAMASSVGQAVTPEGQIERLAPLADLFSAIGRATDGLTVNVSTPVPELGLEAGPIALQQLLIDYVLFAWAPIDSDRQRVQWALAEMLLTGPQTYLDADVLRELLAAAGLQVQEVVSGPSGHLAIALRT